MQFIIDNHLVCSGISRLHNEFTYCKDDGTSTSWIDHILCTKVLDDRITEVVVHYEFQSSDHKPLGVSISDICIQAISTEAKHVPAYTVKYDWSKGDIARYHDIPQCVIGCSYACNNIISAVDKYYADIVSCIRQCTDDCIPQIRNRINCYNVPGWSDVVKDKHAAARSAFLDWVSVGKPRDGYVYQLMYRTRVEFKLALRHCKAAEEQFKADARARALACKQNPGAFWKGISKDSCKKATSHVNKAGDAVGADDACEMWQEHFGRLYNVLDCVKSKQEFFSKVSAEVSCQESSIAASDVDGYKISKER